MDFKKIEQLVRKHRKSESDLTAAITEWLDDVVKEDDYLEFGDFSFYVLLETDDNVKITLCEGVGKSSHIIGGIYCREKDGYEMLPEELDPIDLYNVALSVKCILEENRKQSPHIKVGGLAH